MVLIALLNINFFSSESTAKDDLEETVNSCCEYRSHSNIVLTTKSVLFNQY